MKRSLAIILNIILVLAITFPVAAISTIAVKSISFSSNYLAVKIGQTSSLKVALTPANTTQKRLSYTTGDKKIATVDAAGRITGVKLGTTTITAKSVSNSKIFAKFDVTVISKNATVNVYTNHATQPAWLTYVKTFEDRTGIKVNTIAAPQQDLKIVAMLSSGDNSFDVLYTDESGIHAYPIAGFIAPIDDVMTPDVCKDFPPDYVKRECTTNGKLYGVPGALDGMYFYVNKKMFSDAGLKYPKTQAELITVGKKLTHPDGGIWGLGAPWYKYGGMQNDFFHYVLEFGGSYYDWTLPGTRDALKWMYDIVNTYKIFSIDALPDTLPPFNQKLGDGKYAMAFSWTSSAGAIGDKFPKDIEIAPMPMFKTNKTIAASWFYTLNSKAINVSEAKLFLKYAASVEGQTVGLNLSEGTAANIKVTNNPVNIAAKPALQFLKMYADAGSISSRNLDPNAGALGTAFGDCMSQYILKQISLDDCIKAGQAALDELYKKK